MGQEVYKIRVEAENSLAAQQATRSLSDDLRQMPSVLAIEQQKQDTSTMDLGTIVEVLATSGSTLAIARGVADWLRRTRGTRLVITKDLKSGSIKAQIENITPEVSERITELILRA
jgi:hypothetical protein